MKCPTCQGEARGFGKNRNGSQRYQCAACNRTFTPKTPKALGNMRIDAGKAVMCLRMLLEGSSIRSVERLTGVNRNTIMSLVVTVGTRCADFLEKRIKKIAVSDVQADEVWSFIGMKEKTRIRKGCGEEFGDAYCFTALERNTKLLITWHLGRRCQDDTVEFANKLAIATTGRFQLTTDGFKSYPQAIRFFLGNRVDYAQLVKVYGHPQGDDHNYTPPQIVDTYSSICCGSPDDEAICTSHVERHNKTMRMQIRRMTRLTDAHSKKWENHEAALGLFFAFYNFVRVHSTIKSTPAMAAGLTDHVWNLGELLMEVAKTSTQS